MTLETELVFNSANFGVLAQAIIDQPAWKFKINQTAQFDEPTGIVGHVYFMSTDSVLQNNCKAEKLEDAYGLVSVFLGIDIGQAFELCDDYKDFIPHNNKTTSECDRAAKILGISRDEAFSLWVGVNSCHKNGSFDSITNRTAVILMLKLSAVLGQFISWTELAAMPTIIEEFITTGSVKDKF